MTGGNRQPAAGDRRTVDHNAACALLDLHKAAEIENGLEDLEQALTQLRSTLKATN